MKRIASKFTKSHLIWLVSIALLFNLDMGVENSLTTSLRYFKQTELALSASAKNRKSSHFVRAFYRQTTTYISFGSSFNLRISNQTEVSALKQKISENHLLSTSPKFGHLHRKISAIADDDHSFLIG